MFQFQTGSIRRYCSSRYSKFQFQTGSIRSQFDVEYYRALSFNSKLVRLEGSPKTTLILYCTLTVPVKLIFILIRLEAICCRPLIVQILWEVDGTMCQKGLSAIFR